MPRKTVTRRSGRRHDPPPHQQMELFGAIQSDSLVGAPAWRKLPVEARTALTGLMAQLMLQHAAKSPTPTEREASHDV
jgi:hypothetical protein